MTDLSTPRDLSRLTEEQAFGDVLRNDVAIRNYLDPIKRHLASVPGANEVWVNNPCELVIKAGGKVTVIDEPLLHYQALDALAQAVAVYAQQKIDAAHPLLSATLPDGERIQILLPPAVEPGFIVVAIRVHGDTILSLDKYEADGVFNRFLWGCPRDIDARMGVLQHDDVQLLGLLREKRLKEFLIEAVRAEKTIAVVGDTGSGKTTLMKSMCQYIPRHERLLTIEDVRELLLPQHHNRAHLLYSKGGQSVAKIDPRDLIGTCMRLSPDRVLLAELRGAEAWDFLKLLTTGHRGSITSYHAESCALAFERFMFMAKENPESASLTRSELKHLVSLTVDVVVHITARDVYDAQGKAIGVDRFIDEVHFDPLEKLEARFGDREIVVGGPQ